MNRIQKFLSVFALFALLALTFAAPARAFDGRSGETVIIKADEVINDDLYVSASEFVLDGAVKGDLFVTGQSITINGTVEGDVMAAGQSVVINGSVADDARIAGAALQLGPNANIGSDLLAFGASLETQKGSTVGADVIIGAAQVLLAGNIAGDVLAGAGSLELRGEVGGDVTANVGEADQSSGPPPSMYMPQSSVSIPTVPPGLTISKEAKIKGNLKYTQTKDVTIPSGIIGGKITRTTPVAGPQEVQPTAGQKVTAWALGMIRIMVTLILFGLLLGWLFPTFMKTLPEKINSQPWASLGWGAIAWAAFFFALFVIVLLMILGGMLFGFLTLGGVSGTILWLGILSLLAFTVFFILVTSYLTKIVVGGMMGKWILAKVKPDLAAHPTWPMLVGVIVLIFIVELFRFPLLPLGFFGWLINFAVILCGLGALWIWGREKFAKKPEVVSQ